MQVRIAPWAAAAALALAPALAPTTAYADNPFQVVMSGLDNPYGLAFGPNGALYVAEAGTGGSTPAFVNGNHEALNFGDTGAIAELLNGVQSTPISGLPSLATPGAPGSATSAPLIAGSEATGLQGLTFANGTLYGVFGLGGVLSQLTTLEGTPNIASNVSDLGDLVSFNLTPGAATPVTPLDNVAAYDTAGTYAANNPKTPTDVEANPYSVTTVPGGNFAVADAGGNVLLDVPTTGVLPSLLSVLPAVQNPEFNGGHGLGGPFVQAVPTVVTNGPGGNLYIGEYNGFPFPKGYANVFSYNPTLKQTTTFATGFTTITGMVFGPNGDLYVLDQTTNGGVFIPGVNDPGNAQLIQYDPTTDTQTVLGTLDASYVPTSITYGNDAIYISTLGGGANTGQVLRYSLAAVPESSPFALLALGLLPLGLLAARRRRTA